MSAAATDCLFCKIVKKEIPASFVHEDADVVAFEDIAPGAPTHLLVVPKAHLARLSEAQPEHAALLGKILAAAARIAREKSLGDFRVVMNDGAQAGQSVFHVHLHLLAGRPFAWPPG